MSAAKRCARCPRAMFAACEGESTPRLCELVDPTHPDHDPAYLVVLEPREELAYPSLATQARNLAGSLATWLRAGLPLTPAAERARRRGICTGGEGRPSCDQFDPNRRRCRACGCFGDLKPWLGTTTCPLGRWDPPPQDAT